MELGTLLGVYVEPISAAEWLLVAAAAGALAGQILGNKTAGGFFSNLFLGLFGGIVGIFIIGLFVNIVADSATLTFISAGGAILIVAIGRVFGIGRRKSTV